MVRTDKLSTVEDRKSVGKLWAIRPLLECENPDSLVFSRRVGGHFCVPAEGFEPYAVVGGVGPWRSAKNRCSRGTPSTLGADWGFDSVSNGYTNGYT